MTYSILKLIHIGALVFWLGPALGSWLVLKYSQMHVGEESNTTYLIYKVFFFTVTLEHIALVFLLGTGAIMAHFYWSWAPAWLGYKLLIILIVIIPIEIVDIYLGNWKVEKLVEKRRDGVTLTSQEESVIDFYHGVFTKTAILLIPTSVICIMWLAISKGAPFL